MIALELFAGAAGFAGGLHEAGWDHVALVEKDPHAAATARATGLGPVIQADCNSLDVSCLRGIDALVAGFPCQPFSTAGERKGAADERDGWPATLRAIDATRAPWALLENVPGLTQHSKDKAKCGNTRTCPGCYFETILAALRERFAFVSWRILCAADFGVPQRRYRVFIACGPVPFAWPEPSHSEIALVIAKWRTGSYWRDMDAAGQPSARELRLLAALDASPVLPPEASLQPWQTVREALGLHPLAQGRGGGSNPSADYPARTERDITDEPCTVLAAQQAGNAGPWLLDPNQRLQSIDIPSHTLCTGEGGRASTYLLIPHDSEERTISLDLSVDVPSRTLRAQPGCALSLYTHQTSARAGGRIPCRHGVDEPAPTVRALEGTGSVLEEWRYPQAYRALHPDRPSTTIHVGNGPHGAPLAPVSRRRLTWAECAILQDFPQGHPFKGPETRIYRQIGNACPRAFGRELGKVIRLADRRAA